jgi:4-hydroxyacetophenone monooxygenase
MSTDREAIGAALEHANVPALLVTLIHLTGDLELLDGPIRPRQVWGDAQMGLSEQQQAEVRARAVPVIAELGDRGAAHRFRPTPEQVRDMASFLVGQSVGDDYLEFLLREVGLEPNPTGAEGFERFSVDKRAGFHVVIVGAGMSGIFAAHRLGEAGITYTVIEKNADVGGTWLENTYPGCRVDTPNHSYSYSSVPRDWPQYFSSQPVLLDYFQDCATRFGIRDRIRFSTEVERLLFDESEQCWTVYTRDADGAPGTLRANAVISAVGQLNRPRIPEIPGRETFRGPAFHTARWDHEVALAGKRIAVIGTGASAFQAVPRIAPGAAEVFLFQRTPPWVNPRPDYHRFVPEGKHWLLNNVPHYERWYRMLQFWLSAEGALDYIYAADGWNEAGSVSKKNRKLRRMLVRHAEKSLGDNPELLAKCIPDYPPGGKRMLYDDGTWFDTLQRPNVHLITDPIARIAENGPVTAAGECFEADVLIYATGFRTTDMLYPMQVIGRGGIDLRESWRGSPRAYRGVTIPGFPNLFCLYGPNTNVVVNTSIVILSECGVDYILCCLRLLLETGQRSLECRQQVHDAYNEWIDAGNARTAWGAPGVRSWYKNDSGRVTQNWPYRLLDFWKQTRSADAADYLFR